MNSYYCDNRSLYPVLLRFAIISGNYDFQIDSDEAREIVGFLISSSPRDIQDLYTILPLIYYNLNRTKLADSIQPEALKLLKETSLKLVMKDMVERGWIKKYLVDCKKRNYPIILLKGAAFSGTLYPDNTPRVGVDIDFLVKRADFDLACTTLGKTMEPVVQDSARLATHEALFERTFSSKKTRVPSIEVHRGLTNPFLFNIDEDRLWSESREHPVYDSSTIRILSPVDTLLHIAVHAFRDLTFCSHNLLDAHEVWCQWKPDEKELVGRARRWGATKVLYYLLASSKSIIGTPISESLLSNLEPKNVVNKINERILRGNALQIQSHSSFKYRTRQLVGQLTFPDSLIRGAQFQLYYLHLRIKDWFLSRRVNGS